MRLLLIPLLLLVSLFAILLYLAVALLSSSVATLACTLVILLSMATISYSIQAAIQQKIFDRFAISGNINFHAVGGGSINETYRIQVSDTNFFCKINSATKFPTLFHKEAAGLALVEKQAVIKVPSTIDCFEQDEQQVLLLQWITEGEQTEAFWKRFGEQLAALHQVTNEHFGLNENNYMGSVPQQNNYCSHWPEFFIYQRLEPMMNQCLSKKLLTASHLQKTEKLYNRLPAIFDDDELPSLLHGDLWSGNFMCDEAGKPVLIDPAVYYGHRSVDLAMTTLFGGFRQSFYDAYNYHFPLPKNYKDQWDVCNLYPLLIHLYLFGGSYLPQIERILNQFL